MKEKLNTITNLFEGNEIRSIWDSEKEEYYFSVVDVIGALTNSKIPKRYWSDLKIKLDEEGSQLYEKIVQLKMTAKDRKMRITDTLDIECILRIIESVPSPKAQPFKMQLASFGKEHKPYGLDTNKKVAKAGGDVAKVARDNLEAKLGKSVISNENTLYYKYTDNNKLENKLLVQNKCGDFLLKNKNYN